MLVKIGSVLSKWTANSAGKQDLNKVLAFIFEKARRKVFQSKKFLTTAVLYIHIKNTCPALWNVREDKPSLVVMDNCSSNVKLSSNNTFMKSVGTELSDDDKTLPYLYCTPKAASLYCWFL